MSVASEPQVENLDVISISEQACSSYQVESSTSVNKSSSLAQEMQETSHTISASRHASSASQVCRASGRAATDIPQLTSAQGGSEDIARYIDGTKTPEQLNRLINAMDRGTKYQLLSRHFVPYFDYKFPETYDNGCHHSFRMEYTRNHPWLKYSPRLVDAFCVPCALFAAGRSNNLKRALVTIQLMGSIH